MPASVTQNTLTTLRRLLASLVKRLIFLKLLAQGDNPLKPLPRPGGACGYSLMQFTL